MQQKTPKWHDFPARQLSERPDAPAFSDSAGEVWSYAQLDRAVTDLADRLRQLGVASGDRVMLLSENCCPTIATLFACSQIGACVMPVNARLTGAEVDRILEFTQPVLVLFTTSVSQDASGHADRMGAEAMVGEFGKMHLSRFGENIHPCLKAPLAADKVFATSFHENFGEKNRAVKSRRTVERLHPYAHHSGI